jgi:serine/threonine protein kinase
MPDTIGRYRIDGKLGEGGMGVVYAARDERLGRRVAIKTIRATSDAIARERLWREARSAASVSHPNICQLFEIGEDNGELFIAMELLEGEPLSAALGRGPLPFGQAVDIALALLDALETLHRHGLVHRDVKPSNVFVTPHVVKLLDFGLTVKSAPAGDTLSGITTPGMVLGTPAYMAPEQALGRTVDARADLFSTGVILFEMLTGHRPFAGSSAVEMIHATAYASAPSLSGTGEASRPPIVSSDGRSRSIRRTAIGRPRRWPPS